MSLSVGVRIERWWATLDHDRRETVMGSIYEDDMAVGRVFAEMRQLGLIHPGEARRTADAHGSTAHLLAEAPRCRHPATRRG